MVGLLIRFLGLLWLCGFDLVLFVCLVFGFSVSVCGLVDLGWFVWFGWKLGVWVGVGRDFREFCCFWDLLILLGFLSFGGFGVWFGFVVIWNCICRLGVCWVLLFERLARVFWLI